MGGRTKRQWIVEIEGAPTLELWVEVDRHTASSGKRAQCGWMGEPIERRGDEAAFECLVRFA